MLDILVKRPWVKIFKDALIGKYSELIVNFIGKPSNCNLYDPGNKMGFIFAYIRAKSLNDEK